MNCNVIFFILFALLFGQFEANGQHLKSEEIDSLKHELAKANSDTVKVQVLFAISMLYQSFDTDSAMAYVLSSLENAETINYTKGRADALLHIGRLKRDLDQPAEALNEMFIALQLYRKINDQVQIANALNDISIIYANSEDYEKSLEYFKQALEIFRQTGDKKGESYALNNIGVIYQDLGDETMAKQYFVQSLKIKEKNNDLYGISRGYNNLGSIAEHNNQWKEALSYYFRADSLFEKTRDLHAQSANFVAIARVKDKQGRSDEAHKFALLALEKSEEVKALSTILSASALLATIEEQNRNYKSALQYQKLYNKVADSLSNEKNKANLEELKARFNIEEKEREIALLKKDKELHEAGMVQRNIITYSLSACIVMMMLILGLVFYAYNTVKSKKNSLTVKNMEIEQQKDDLDKLNKEKDRFFSILSHDLRVPLNSLKGLSYLMTEHTNALTPGELMEMRAQINTSLDNLGTLINNILDWSITTFKKRSWNFTQIPIRDIIEKNISLYQTIAESKGVKLIHDCPEQLYGYADYYAIDTVLRNLLSNSIKFSHAYQDVLVTSALVDDKVLISVKDHGIGIPLEIQGKLFTLNGDVTQRGTNNEKGTGLGLTLCKELLKENHGDIHVKSQPGKGSEFIVSLLKYKK